MIPGVSSHKQIRFQHEKELTRKYLKFRIDIIFHIICGMSIKVLNNKTVDFLDDINAKYATLECEIEQKLAAM